MLIEIVDKFYSFIASGSIDSLVDTLLTEDIQWIINLPESVPYSGNYQGRQGVRAFFDTLVEVETLTAFTPLRFLPCSSDTVVVVGSEAGKSNRTQKEFSVHWVQIFKITQGKISSFEEHIEFKDIVAAYSD